MSDRTYAICQAIFWTATGSALLILTVSAIVALTNL